MCVCIRVDGLFPDNDIFMFVLYIYFIFDYDKNNISRSPFLIAVMQIMRLLFTFSYHIFVDIYL